MLVALEVLSKEGKQVGWLGMGKSLRDPEAIQLEAQQCGLKERAAAKHAQLKKLIGLQVAFKQLLALNCRRHSQVDEADKIAMPFVLVATASPTSIDGELTEGRERVRGLARPPRAATGAERAPGPTPPARP